MISNQILQNTIDGIKSISRVDLSILDTDGKVLVSTMSDVDAYDSKEAIAFSQSQADTSAIGECQYFKIFEERQLEYVLMVKGSGLDDFLVGRMAAFQIQGLIIAYKERFDKDNFIKNLLLDNLLLVDIYNRAKRLHLDVDKHRVVFILENSPDRDQASLENIRMLFGNKNSDFVTTVDETCIIIVKELEEGNDYETCEQTAKAIMEVVGQDGDNKTLIAYGTIVDELKDVSKSYKEAQMALDIGKIFFPDRDIIAYSTLGIGRLIYQLPIPLCKMFIKEIFSSKTPDDFDEETITTIDKFFENNLNVSETSRQLFIHRNTLVYRLDKLQKNTGLDLRVFEDAITFKIALMVVRYMKHMEMLDY